MANVCMYDLKIAGREEAVQEFVDMLSGEGSFKGMGFGRVTSFERGDDPIEYGPKGSGLVAVTGYGDCCWSVKHSMKDAKPSGLEDICERLGLVVEIYSSEPGNRFQEHFLCDKGNLEIEDSVEYEEWHIDGMRPKDLMELAQDKHLSVEMLKARVNSIGDYTVGGYGDQFAVFCDLFSFFDHVKFIFDDELLVCQDRASNCIEGYVWAVDALVEPLKAQEARHLSAEDLEDMENINFYPVFDVRHNKVTISGNYYVGEEHYSFDLPISEEDSQKLIEAMESYCQKHLGCSCLEAVDKFRDEHNFCSIAGILALEEKLKNAEAIEYKGIIFDDWTIDEEYGNIYGEMCQCCADKYKDLLKDELSAGGMGACSVKGCSVVGADTDYDRHYYVDFYPNLIKAIERKPSLAALCADASSRQKASVNPQLLKSQNVERG